MDRTLDIFKNDAFSQANLRRVLPNMPFTPGALGQMNLFQPHYIDTETVLIYMENGMIRLIPDTLRGAPDILAERQTGEFRAVKTRRLSKKDDVRASELLGLADQTFPLDQRLRTAAGLVNQRMGQLRTDMEATRELHRLGAIQGKLLDADGTTVLVNYFDVFGIAEPTPVGVNFGTLTEDEIAAFFQAEFYIPMYRSLQVRSGGTGMVPAFRVGALVSDDFWFELMKHPGVREIWKLNMQARAIAEAQNPLVTPPLWESFTFGNVTWIHYMGALSGPLQVPDGEAIIFPIGAKDVFDVYFSPGETLSQVQGVGQELYPMLRVDPRDDPEFIELFLRSYPLYACIYPQVLMRAEIAP